MSNNAAILDLITRWRDFADGHYCKTYNKGMAQGLRRAANDMEEFLAQEEKRSALQAEVDKLAQDLARNHAKLSGTSKACDCALHPLIGEHGDNCPASPTALCCPGCGSPLEMQDSVWFCPGDPEVCEFAANDWNAGRLGEDAPTGRNVL